MKRFSVRSDDLLICLVGTAIGAALALIVNLAASVEVEESWEVELPTDQPVEVHLAPRLRRTPAAAHSPAEGEQNHA